MALSKLLGSKTARSLTALSVLNEARRALSRGRRTRALVLLGVAALAWKWTVVGLAAQGVLKVVGGDKQPVSA